MSRKLKDDGWVAIPVNRTGPTVLSVGGGGKDRATALIQAYRDLDPDLPLEISLGMAENGKAAVGFTFPDGRTYGLLTEECRLLAKLVKQSIDDFDGQDTEEVDKTGLPAFREMLLEAADKAEENLKNRVQN